MQEGKLEQLPQVDNSGCQRVGGVLKFLCIPTPLAATSNSVVYTLVHTFYSSVFHNFAEILKKYSIFFDVYIYHTPGKNPFWTPWNFGRNA